MPLMTNLFVIAATALTLVSAGGHGLGGPIGGSTGFGSGTGHQGTGPGWSNGTIPQPLTYSAPPPGGYGHGPSSPVAPQAMPTPPLFH
jgi:hypothetical protein